MTSPLGPREKRQVSSRGVGGSGSGSLCWNGALLQRREDRSRFSVTRDTASRAVTVDEAWINRGRMRRPLEAADGRHAGSVRRKSYPLTEFE
jgi:hypothetical protein